MSYLQCPECRLTVPSAAYYLRGDECPRCLSTMQKRATFRSGITSPPPLPLMRPAGESGSVPARPA